MTTVADILKSRPTRWSTRSVPMPPMFEAVSLMAVEEHRALLVVEHGQMVGIVSERDYAARSR